MHRPRLTRKRIEGLMFAMGLADCDVGEMKMNESDRKEYKKEIDAYESASDYLSQLCRWHRQKTNERKTK